MAFHFFRLFANESVADKRGYRFKTNPEIQLFDNLNLTLKLAINTQQYGRVFQDRYVNELDHPSELFLQIFRSYTFEIRQRPAEFQDRPIYNLNVRGRRGNIVQGR